MLRRIGSLVAAAFLATMRMVATSVPAFIIGAPIASAQSYDDKDKKVTICHYPPGNPENVQVITVSESAFEAHKKHGDVEKDPKKPCPPKKDKRY